MAPALNWQIHLKHSGHKCYVPTHDLSNLPTWGRIGDTQVTRHGSSLPRVTFVPGPKAPLPENYLLKLSLLKRSLAGARYVDTSSIKEGTQTDIYGRTKPQIDYKAEFFSTFQLYANLNAEVWGADIIIGEHHKHYSSYDEGCNAERKGNYKALPPIPAAFVVDGYGNVRHWVSPPLSDSRSVGRWVKRYGQFFIGGDTGEDDNKVPDDIIIRRVGHYYLKR